jgi:hypothetical protein
VRRGRGWRAGREAEGRRGREAEGGAQGAGPRGGCWNLLSAARRPTRVNSGDNRVTCTGARALFI